MMDLVYTEYSDGSCLVAKIEDGKLVECPVIKISPPHEWGGSMTLSQAIKFLTDIRERLEKSQRDWAERKVGSEQ